MIRHTQYNSLNPTQVKAKLEEFFKEDNVSKDITTTITQIKNQDVQAVIYAKEKMVFAGREIIVQAFNNCRILIIENDGEHIDKGQSIAVIQGPIKTILNKERVVLNLLQRLSGIASKTNNLTKKTIPHNIQLLDTRKTTPGLREFEKFAVFIGGGTNHRMSLSDAIMIKDNHLMGKINIVDAIKQAYNQHPGKEIQVEVDTEAQLDLVLNSQATSVLLDNFKPEMIKKLIPHIRSHVKGKNIYIELSGGITETTILNYCIEGVNGISMGGLTHNIKSKDISLDIK